MPHHEGHHHHLNFALKMSKCLDLRSSMLERSELEQSGKSTFENGSIFDFASFVPLMVTRGC